jgi:hypothetical protein
MSKENLRFILLLRNGESWTYAQGHVTRIIKYCVTPGALESTSIWKKSHLRTMKYVARLVTFGVVTT